MVVIVQATACLWNGIYKDVKTEVEVSDVAKPGDVWEAANKKIMANAGKFEVVAVGLKEYEVKQ